MAGRDTNVGSKRARETRAALGLDAEAPLGCALTRVEADLGLPVVVAALPDGIAGACVRRADGTMLWVNGTDAPARQRFTLAHEVGHVRCGHDGATPVDTWRTLAGRTTDGREVQANAFAAELLAPAAGVRALVGADPGLEDAVRVAARYGVSTIAAVYRLGTLRLTERVAALAAAVEAGEHEAVWTRLDVRPHEDALSRITTLPRLSPGLGGSALAAVLTGDASTQTAAAAAGCDAAALARGTAAIGL